MSATIVVEDGTEVSGANSYVTTAELATYADERGVTITGTAADLLIQAMDYLEQQNFKGVKNTSTQALQWPRYNVYIDSYYVTSTTIPQLLKDAECEIALAIDAGNNPLATIDRVARKEKVGPIEVEYAAGASDSVYIKAAEWKLRKLLAGGRFTMFTVRA